MISILLLSCFPTIMTNLTQEPWNNFDMKTLDSAKIRCAQIYKGYPCVKEFIKNKDSHYGVTCGKETLI